MRGSQEGRKYGRKGKRGKRGEGGQQEGNRRKEYSFFFFKTATCFINLMRKLKYHQYKMKPLSRKNNFQEFLVIKSLYRNIEEKPLSV